jgi:hypothetical protein
MVGDLQRLWLNVSWRISCRKNVQKIQNIKLLKNALFFPAAFCRQRPCKARWSAIPLKKDENLLGAPRSPEGNGAQTRSQASWHEEPFFENTRKRTFGGDHNGIIEGQVEGQRELAPLSQNTLERLLLCGVVPVRISVNFRSWHKKFVCKSTKR